MSEWLITQQRKISWTPHNFLWITIVIKRIVNFLLFQPANAFHHCLYSLYFQIKSNVLWFSILLKMCKYDFICINRTDCHPTKTTFHYWCSRSTNSERLICRCRFHNAFHTNTNRSNYDPHVYSTPSYWSKLVVFHNKNHTQDDGDWQFIGFYFLKNNANDNFP